jgi:hypothetical protein
LQALSEQLDKIISNAANLAATAPVPTPSTGGASLPAAAATTAQTTLAAFLVKRSPGKSQVRKFLATAAWLSGNGKNKITTSEVSQSLSTNHQGKLSNPSDCLNKNVAKGHCVKEGKEFYITPDGHKSLSGDA